jgi:peptidoglycan/xylan/chitin deacetylase (PgdA/CDA1 family)
MTVEQALHKSFTISVNVHGSSVELKTVSAERLVGRYAYGSYMPIGVERIMRLLQKHKIRATFFVPGAEARMKASLVREIVAAGHEVAAHGDALEDHSTLGDAEADVLKRAHDSISAVIGAAPVGWRAPDGMFSKHTIPLLAGMGYLYDSSFQDDDFPYSLAPEGGGKMIEVPQNEMLIDQVFFAIRQTHDRVLKNWTEEFDGANAAGCFSCMTLHPRQDYGVARASRIDMLDAFITHVSQTPGVTFRTCAEAAQLAAVKL